MNTIRLPFSALLLIAAPALAQTRLPAPLPPMSTNPPPFGIDTMSSGIPERAASLRVAVGIAFQKGLIDRGEADRLALPLARIQQQLQFHTPRGYRERVRLRQRLDTIQAELDRALAHG